MLQKSWPQSSKGCQREQVGHFFFLKFCGLTPEDIPLVAEGRQTNSDPWRRGLWGHSTCSRDRRCGQRPESASSWKSTTRTWAPSGRAWEDRVPFRVQVGARRHGAAVDSGSCRLHHKRRCRWRGRGDVRFAIAILSLFASFC